MVYAMRADEITSAHNSRLRTIDALLPEDPPVPADAIVDGVVLTAPSGLALATVDRADLESPLATWSVAEEHRLVARVGEPTAMRDLLRQWDKRIHAAAPVDDADSQAAITWPSRDAVMTPMFREHDLVPQSILAYRPLRSHMTATRGTDVPIRPLRMRDVDRATELYLAEVAWDRQFNGMIPRASTEANARAELVTSISGEQPWTWVAEVDGDVVGVLVASSPENSGWVTHRAAARRVAYISIMMVDPAHQGCGVGNALVVLAHNAFEDRGVEGVLLHYAALSPLSGPFWHRAGYRPLWTSWTRRPARASYPRTLVTD